MTRLPVPDPVHLALRHATQAAHRRLDAALCIAGDDAGQDAYRTYVAALYGWLAPLEPRLWRAAWPVRARAAERDGKSAWLEADLVAAGLGPQEIRALPRCASLPPTATPEARFGVGYVIEGAQLGGQYLWRTLGARLAPWPARWLQGYGRETGLRWQEFLAALPALSTAAQVERACEAAVAAFESLHRWCERRGATR